MQSIHRACLPAFFCVAATGAAATAAAASETVRTYTVTSISETAAGRSVLREVLSLERNGDASRLRVSDGNGSMFVTPVALTAAGQIASSSQDRSVTCYNMAMNVLAHQQPQLEPPSVYVQFASSVVAIPLRVEATSERGSLKTLALDGATAGVLRAGDTFNPAGVLIGATVDETNGALRDAMFDEVHYIGKPANIIARSSCILQQAAPASTTTQT